MGFNSGFKGLIIEKYTTGMSHLKRRRRRKALFFIDIETFIVCSVLQPPLN